MTISVKELIEKVRRRVEKEVEKIFEDILGEKGKTNTGGEVEHPSYEDLEYELKIFVQPGCPMCQYVKEAFKDEINSGKIELIDTSTVEGSKIADDLDIKTVPTPVLVKGDFEDVIVCRFVVEDDKIFLQCNGDEQLEEASITE